jgi:hypothetical protein
MSDEELRRLEREIAVAPHLLDLRRQHALALSRLGREEEALAALDLAWRLGAVELWEELHGRLAARRVEVAGLKLGWVPAGPFAMGSEELDDDCAPVHVVELSGFWVAERALSYGVMETWSHYPSWARRDWPGRREWLETPISMARDVALDALAHLNRGALPPDLRGTWALPTEAQWERVFRACYLRPDGACPYGAVRSKHEMPEWTRDRYHPDWYRRSPRRDPAGPAAHESHAQTFVVRGVPYLPDPEFALYREAAKADSRFDVGDAGGSTRWVQHEHGIALRPVFLPAPP